MTTAKAIRVVDRKDVPADERTNESLREHMVRWQRKVKFSAEEIAAILDDVGWILAHRYRETSSVPIEEWGDRIMAELMINEDRKATKEHGEPDLTPWLDAMDSKGPAPET